MSQLVTRKADFIKETVLSTIQSDKFKLRLSEINQHYFNLKQESFIRNSILELINQDFKESYRAIAEHPRINKTRVDLSIVSESEPSKHYKVEFKFHFTKDFHKDVDYVPYIDRDYYDRRTDMFILIVASWDVKEKDEFDIKWGIEKTNSLSKYVSKDEDWEDNYHKHFENYNKETLLRYESNFNKVELVVDNPYKTRYLFYILSKK